MVALVEEVLFNTLDELHDRLMPALKSKRKILNKSGYSYIKEEHIWDYMLKGKWKDKENIALCDMVDDILHTDNYAISEYYHTTFKSRDEALYKDVDLPRLKS